MNEPTSNEAYAIREVTFEFAVSPINTTATLLGVPRRPSAYNFSYNSWCEEGYYWDGPGYKCIKCDSSCKSCFALTNQACFACVDNYVWDGYACVPCDAYCNATYSGYGASIDANIACETGKYNYNNEACLPDCNSPLVSISNGSLYCNKPCTGTTLLQLNNVTCGAASDCSLPFTTSSVSTILGNIATCVIKCPLPLYLNWNGTCISSCPLPWKTVTATVNGTNIQYCQKPCGTSYAYPNGSCNATCDSAYLGQSVTQAPGTIPQCLPKCADPLILNYNGTCITSCNLPFKKTSVVEYSVTINTCATPCGSDYVYPDYSCGTSCTTGYKAANYTDIPGTVPSCVPICSTTQYLNYNLSCIGSCPSPFINSTSGGFKLCNLPCNNGSYVYSDGSCSTDCDSPMINSTFTAEPGTIPTCNSPCATNKYLKYDGTCTDSCLSPLVIQTINKVKECNKPCSTGQYYYPSNGKCSATCSGQIKTENGVDECILSDESSFTFIDYLSTPASAGVPSFAVLHKLILHIRYININFPTKLQRLGYGKAPIPTLSNLVYYIPESILSQIPNYSLPTVFSKYNISSDFTSNMVKNFGSYLVIVLVMGALMLIKQSWSPTVYKIRRMLQWNLIIMMLSLNMDDTILFTILQIMSLNFDNYMGGVSLALCIVSNFVNCAVLFFAIYFPYKLYKIRKGEKQGGGSLRKKEADFVNKLTTASGCFYLSFTLDELISVKQIFWPNSKSLTS